MGSFVGLALGRVFHAFVMSQITVELVKNPHRNAYVSVDGGKAQKLNMGDKVVIRKSRLETKLIRLKDRSFYDVVNAKFMKSSGDDL